MPINLPKSLIVRLFPLITVVYCPSSYGQVLPRIDPPPLEKPPEIQPLAPLEEVLPELQPPPTPPSPLEQIPGEIIVKQFDVIGSTVFSAQQLTTILEPYTNRPISFAELVQAQEAISQLYIENGYVTSGAFIPPQTLEDGVVKIQVIEGTVESIEIQGLDRLAPDYIRSRLEIATEAPLNQNELLNALQILQLNPLIRNISAELAAGTQPGTSVLQVQVREASAFSALASYDNYRNPSVGTKRILGQITHHNLLGWGDRFNATYYHTTGSDSLDDLSYTLPVNPDNGTVNIRFRLTDSKVIQPIFEPFDLQSQYRKYEFSYRQPVIETPNQEFALGITGDWQTSANFLLGEPFPLSRGADERGKTRIFALRFFQEYNRRDQRQVFVARSQFNVGFEAFGATNNSDGIPDSSFFAWRGQAQYLNLLSPDTILLLRADLQLANKALLPVEQFSVGGVFSVRGYSQDALLADNGFFASAEVRTNILKIPEWNTTLQLAPFFDVGTVWNTDNVPLQTKSLYSTGLGLRLSIGDTFSARLDWGLPIADFVDSNNTLQSDGIYFSFQLTPFD
jgi:hemolysin activation/secretion protein